jgi:hypothetical protein
MTGRWLKGSGYANCPRYAGLFAASRPGEEARFDPLQRQGISPLLPHPNRILCRPRPLCTVEGGSFKREFGVARGVKMTKHRLLQSPTSIPTLRGTWVQG